MFRVFGCTGCTVYVFLEQRFRKKLDSTAERGVFLGYDPYCPAYLVGLPNEKGVFNILQTRNIKFDETSSFFFDPVKTRASGGSMDYVEPVAETKSQGPTTPVVIDVHEPDVEDVGTEVIAVAVEPELRRSDRTRRAHLWLNDFVDGEGLVSEVDHGLSVDMPKNANEALQNAKWAEAMTKEHRSLIENEAWDLVTLPEGRTAVGGRWHLCVERGSSGEILRYKARYVAKGYSQVYGRDYDETFSPTVKLSTVRCILACAAQETCNVDQMDIRTAFLNAPIDEEVYVCQPEGFEEYDERGSLLYCKLKTSLYGLNQAGRNWYMTISEYLKFLGFEESRYDHCLFVRCDGKTRSYICLWVDDLIYFSTDSDFSNYFRDKIAERFQISDQSQLSWFLGMKVEFGPGWLHFFITGAVCFRSSGEIWNV